MTWPLSGLFEADRIVSWALGRVPSEESIEDAAKRVQANARRGIEQPRGALEAADVVLGPESDPVAKLYAARDVAVKRCRLGR